MDKIVRLEDEQSLINHWPNSEFKEAQPLMTRLFGESLEVVQPDGRVPIPIDNMINWLGQNALQVDGIFRRSADSQTLESLKSYLNASNPSFASLVNAKMHEFILTSLR